MLDGLGLSNPPGGLLLGYSTSRLKWVTPGRVAIVVAINCYRFVSCFVDIDLEI